MYWLKYSKQFEPEVVRVTVMDSDNIILHRVGKTEATFESDHAEWCPIARPSEEVG